MLMTVYIRPASTRWQPCNNDKQRRDGCNYRQRSIITYVCLRREETRRGAGEQKGPPRGAPGKGMRYVPEEKRNWSSPREGMGIRLEYDFSLCQRDKNLAYDKRH